MRKRDVRYVVAMGIASAVCVLLFLAESVINHEFIHSYLVWNLFLAWIPLGLAYWLVRLLRDHLWSSWEAMALSVIWLIFLPNSFYIVSDFVHLPDLLPSELLFGVVVTMAFALTGLWLGVVSLGLIQHQLYRRFGGRVAASGAALTLLISSFAIYVGRDLRWNSWDVLTSPFGLLFDLSERLMHPPEYGQVLAVVMPFFVLLASIYFLGRYVAGLFQERIN